MSPDPRPFISHMQLAAEWCRLTRRSTTEASILRMMERYTAEELQAFLRELEIPADRMVSHGVPR